MARCEEKTMEWAKHWQCDTEVQDLKEDMLWMNERLQSLKEGDLEKAATTYKAATMMGCDGFPPQSTAGFVKRYER